MFDTEMNATYTRLFSDDSGESHFEDLTIELSSVDFAPPAVVLLDRAKDRGLPRGVGKVVRMPLPQDTRRQRGMLRLRNQLIRRSEAPNDHENPYW